MAFPGTGNSHDDNETHRNGEASEVLHVHTFWDDLADIGRGVPKEELALLPSAEHFDDEFERA